MLDNGWSSPLFVTKKGIEFRLRKSTQNVFMMKRKGDKYKVKYFCIGELWPEYAQKFGIRAKNPTKKKRKKK